MNVHRILARKAKESTPSTPLIFDCAKASDRSAIARLLKHHAIRHVSDDYEEQLREYFGIMNPGLVYAPDFEDKFQIYLKNIQKKTPLWRHGRWVYFPWLSTLTHILKEDAFQTVRMARNRNLITAEEQKKFYDAVVGIAGLSVGNSVALAIVLSGGARHIRLADYDRLALSNINRIRAGVECLGISKVEMTARQIYVLNPYVRIDMLPEGLTEQNIRKFFEGPPKMNLIVEEIDNLAMKYRVREQAKKFRIPVIMGTDDGDDAVIDIERYDLNPKTPIFHGRLGHVSYGSLRGLSKLKAGFMVARHVGPENVPLRMQQSLTQIGKTIVSWPQLGGSALLNGCALAYVARKIMIGEPLKKNRAVISLDEKLKPGYDSIPRKKKRAAIAKAFGKEIDAVLNS